MALCWAFQCQNIAWNAPQTRDNFQSGISAPLNSNTLQCNAIKIFFLCLVDLFCWIKSYLDYGYVSKNDSPQNWGQYFITSEYKDLSGKSNREYLLMKKTSSVPKLSTQVKEGKLYQTSEFRTADLIHNNQHLQRNALCFSWNFYST